jgi:hypothetical protein
LGFLTFSKDVPDRLGHQVGTLKLRIMPYLIDPDLTIATQQEQVLLQFKPQIM